jgi:hypothetical protein
MSEELKQQREQEGAIIPAAKRALVNGGESPVAGYLSTHAVGVDGAPMKFNPKTGEFVDLDGEAVPAGEYVGVYDMIRGGFIKFDGEGNPPKREQGYLFQGYVPPPRSDLGDADETKWENGLNGQPQDPWQFQLLLPLQHVESGKLFVFQTTSWSGRRAVDQLISACARMQKSEPEHYPVVRLGSADRKGSEGRISYKAPTFARVGKALKSDTSVASTSLADDLNDTIPF